MISSRALRRIVVSLLALPLYFVFGPRAEAAWERLNHGDPILEILATAHKPSISRPASEPLAGLFLLSERGPTHL